MTARVSRALQIGLGLAGLAGALVMVRHTDFDAVRAFGRWVVLVVAVEGLRVFAEAMATRCLLGREVRLPWWPLLRVHLTGYAIAMIMPAGRSVAEASKAVMLRRWLTTERCAGVGATNQALVMSRPASSPSPVPWPRSQRDTRCWRVPSPSRRSRSWWRAAACS